MATAGKRVLSKNSTDKNIGSTEDPRSSALRLPRRRLSYSCCVAFPFLLRGEGASGAPQFNYPSNTAPTDESACAVPRCCRSAVPRLERKERNHGFGREGGRRTTSGEPIVGINCCAPPGTRHATNGRRTCMRKPTSIIWGGGQEMLQTYSMCTS